MPLNVFTSVLCLIIFPSCFLPHQLCMCCCSHPHRSRLSHPLVHFSFLLLCLLSPTLCLVLIFSPLTLPDALFASCPLLHPRFYRHSLAAHTQVSLLCFLKVLQPIEALLSSASLFTQQDVLETPYCPETPPSPSSANHFVSAPDCWQESFLAL